MVDIIVITEAARGFISEIFDNNPGMALVVGYNSVGCAGHKYIFYLLNNTEIPDDVDAVTVANSRVVVQPDSVMGLLGATLDLHVEDFGQQLVWINPAAIGSCGCGDSFQLPGDESCH